MDRATVRGLRAELKTKVRFGPGPRAGLFLALAFAGPAAVLWAAGFKVGDAVAQWIMTIVAVTGIACWAFWTSKYRVTEDAIARRRLGKFDMWRWETLGGIERDGGRWTVRDGAGNEAFHFSGWTGNAAHLAELIEFAIGEAASPASAGDSGTGDS